MTFHLTFGITFNEDMVVKHFLETDSYSDRASLNQAKTGEYPRVSPIFKTECVAKNI